MAYTDIDKPSDYFNTLTYTGDGTTKDITGVGFQPDLVWAKKRSATGFHAWCDSVRGGTKNIFSNSTNAEETSATDWILSFASDGFGVNSAGNLNQSSVTYVAWNWLADNTSGSSNTDGSITSTVRANTTSGFSIVSYTGNGAVTATVGHGLGVTPKMIIYKNLGNAYNWLVYHESLGNTHGMYLNANDASVDNVDFFKDTSPTSSVWTMSNSTLNNQGSINHIAYCFAQKKGFSKFGSYTGNGNADGTFIYTGFKPAFVMMKRTDTTGHWLSFDNKRSSSGGSNLIQQYLYPNLSDAEGSDASEGIDFLSNGFKHINNFSALNASGGTYIYMAFASSPFVTSGGIPTTAR